MKFFASFLLLLLAFLPPSMAQSQAQSPPFVMNFDYARFRHETASSYLELYYSFYCGQLTFQQDGGRLRGGIVLQTKILEEGTGKIVVAERTTLPVVLEDTLSAAWKMRAILRQAGHLLPNGKYSLQVVAHDSLNQARKDSLSLTLNAEPFASHPAISDLELCSSIKPSENKADAYFKNGHEIMPHPALVFDSANHPVVYVYAELYNVEAAKMYAVDYEIVDDAGFVMKKVSRQRRYANANSVEIGTMNAVSYPSGSYFLRLSLKDPANGQSVQAQKKFYVYNPAASEQIATVSGALAMAIEALSAEQVEEEFQQAKYLADKSEIYFFSQLATLEAKKEFLKDFWRKIEAGSDAQPPRSRSEYLQRIAATDQLFSAFKKGGWRTDRGRVFVLYGKPDEIERHPSDAAKPYEIWHYYRIENGVQFVFVEKSGFGDYELVHSTKRGELEDPGWQRFIQ